MKIYLLIIFYFLFVSTEAQVEDRFDDGDFTDSPVWSGNDSDFNVNTERQLQLNAALSGNSFLSVPVNLFTLDSCEWNFYIKLAFSPSTSNFARIYISSDQQDITQPLNGYFLQFGESLSNDAIELFRQDGTSITSVCRARDGFIATAFSARIKLTRDQYGWWTLYADYSGGENYKTEARGNDLFFNSASWMGVDCRYTSGNVNKFYFDDFYAGREIPDTTRPYVSAVEADSGSVLTIIFSEKMDSISITDINNYLVDNNIGHPVEVTGDIINQQKYYLRFTKSFQQEVKYTISFSGLRDVNQNQIEDQIKKFIYSPVMTAHQNDVVFSEIYFENSKLSPLPDAEYIEIFNRMDSSVLISGWKISDGNSDGVISEFRLGPRSYVILYNETDSPDFFSVQNGIGVHSFPSFEQINSVLIFSIDQPPSFLLLLW